MPALQGLVTPYWGLGEELGRAWAMSWSGLQPFLPLTLGLGISGDAYFWQRGLLGLGIRNRRRLTMGFPLR